MVASADTSVRARATLRRRLLLFLGALIVLQFGYPISLAGPVWLVVYLLGYAAMVLFGISIARGDHQRLPAYNGLAVFVVLAGGWYAFQQGSDVALAVMLLAVGLFQLALLLLLFSMILHARRDHTHSIELLLVAIAAYLLLGGVFGMVFGLLETFAPGSFLDPATPDAPVMWQSLLYASYVSLTTLGIGDILPINPWARSLVTLEGVVGTLFLAVVIARLVGSRE
ncbi:MAG: ion channel [Propioniciclava sp.]